MFRLVSLRKLLNYPLNALFQTDLQLSSTLTSGNLPDHHSSEPNLDFKYLCSSENTADIKRNIHNRHASGNIDKVIQLYKDLLLCDSSVHRVKIMDDLIKEALKIPNISHPSLKELKDEPKLIKIIKSSRKWTFRPLKFEILIKKLNLMKTENLTNLVGPRSYFLLDKLAELEEALIQYTLSHLAKHKFIIISVPDLLPRSVIEYCGMDTRGERTQVYSIDNAHVSDICLSGTAEMGIAYFLQRKEFNKSELPLRIAAVSRCFRAETSKISVEKGLYRVHQFTKVEMFGLTSAEASDRMLVEFRNIQETLFTQLGLQLRILDMPECELGAQAYRKYDIECYMPGRQYWGEISSASNCTDYQSRRLGIKCSDGTYAHTINGTACAVPRMLIAILETYQKSDGSIDIPRVLMPYMNCETIRKSKIPNLKNFHFPD